jgi:hypothetical protein
MKFFMLSRLRKNKANRSQSVDLAQRLPRPFGPRNDIRISASLCLCAFAAWRPFDSAQGTLFEKKRDLKKQSQFLGVQNDVKSMLAMTYGDFDSWRLQKNKAKQSQSACFSRKACVYG